MNLIAYGEFQSTTYWGAFNETLPLFCRVVIPPLLLYVACSALVQARKCRAAGAIVYCIAFVLFLPMFTVMGAYGPAHVAMGVGILAWPTFFLLLMSKALLLTARENRHSAGGKGQEKVPGAT